MPAYGLRLSLMERLRGLMHRHVARNGRHAGIQAFSAAMLSVLQGRRRGVDKATAIRSEAVCVIDPEDSRVLS